MLKKFMDSALNKGIEEEPKNKEVEVNESRIFWISVDNGSSILSLNADSRSILLYSLPFFMLNFFFKFSNSLLLVFSSKIALILDLVSIGKLYLFSGGYRLTSFSMSFSWLSLCSYDVLLYTSDCQILRTSLVGSVSSSSSLLLCSCVVFGLCRTSYSYSLTFCFILSLTSFQSDNFSFCSVHQEKASSNTTFLDV